MSRKSKKQMTQIKLVLNDSIALDALILSRLTTLPAARQNGWLQSLLVRGFCDECSEIQALQQTNDEGARYIPNESAATQSASQESVARSPEKESRESGAMERPIDQPVAMSTLKSMVG